MHVALRYTMCTFLFVLKIRCVPTPFLSISRFAIVCSISSFLHILLIIVTLCIAAASTKFIINYGNRNSQETLPASLYTFKDVDRFYFKVKKKKIKYAVVNPLNTAKVDKSYQMHRMAQEHNTQLFLNIVLCAIHC